MTKYDDFQQLSLFDLLEEKTQDTQAPIQTDEVPVYKIDKETRKEICEKLRGGVDEEVIAAYHRISVSDLYNIVTFDDYELAKVKLKHLCNGYYPQLCFGWPLVDEHFCSAFGYEPECPLEKARRKGWVVKDFC